MFTKKNNQLTATIKCEDFMDAVQKINKIAQIAEKLDHHPDIHLHEYKMLTIEVYTHSENAITEKDTSLAQAIESELT